MLFLIPNSQSQGLLDNVILVEVRFEGVLETKKWVDGFQTASCYNSEGKIENRLLASIIRIGLYKTFCWYHKHWVMAVAWITLTLFLLYEKTSKTVNFLQNLTSRTILFFSNEVSRNSHWNRERGNKMICDNYGKNQRKLEGNWRNQSRKYKSRTVYISFWLRSLISSC